MSYRQIEKLRQLRQRRSPTVGSQPEQAEVIDGTTEDADVQGDSEPDIDTGASRRIVKPSVFLAASSLTSDDEESRSSQKTASDHHDPSNDTPALTGSTSLQAESRYEAILPDEAQSRSCRRVSSGSSETLSSSSSSFSLDSLIHEFSRSSIPQPSPQETPSILSPHPLLSTHRHAFDPTLQQQHPQPRRTVAVHHRRFWLLPSAVRDNWPRCQNHVTLTMEQKSLDGKTVFIVTESPSYLRSRAQLAAALHLGFEGILDILRENPFHLDANFLWTLSMATQDKKEEAYESSRRAAHALQSCFHPRFSPFVSETLGGSPQVRLDPKSSGYPLFIATLFVYARLLTEFGAYAAATEVYKLLLGCQEPYEDLTHSLLHLDLCCVETRAVDLLQRLGLRVLTPPQSVIDTPPSVLQYSCDAFLPNFAFSLALTRSRRCTHGGADGRIAFLDNPASEEVNFDKFCVLTATAAEGVTLETWSVPEDYWNTHPSSDRRASQLLLMRALILYPKFLEYFCEKHALLIDTSPRESRSSFTWGTLLASEVFSGVTMKDTAWRERTLQNNLLKCYIEASAKYWIHPIVRAWLHECASLLHHQYDVQDHGSECTYRSEWHARYRRGIREFRNAWATACVAYYRTHRIVETYEDVSTKEFFPVDGSHRMLYLPEQLQLRLTMLSHILQSSERHALQQLFEPPKHWLSLHSNVVFLFVQSLLPSSAVDKRGIYATPITLRTISETIQKFLRKLFRLFIRSNSHGRLHVA